MRYVGLWDLWCHPSGLWRICGLCVNSSTSSHPRWFQTHTLQRKAGVLNSEQRKRSGAPLPAFPAGTLGALGPAVMPPARSSRCLVRRSGECGERTLASPLRENAAGEDKYVQKSKKQNSRSREVPTEPQETRRTEPAEGPCPSRAGPGAGLQRGAGGSVWQNQRQQGGRYRGARSGRLSAATSPQQDGPGPGNGARRTSQQSLGVAAPGRLLRLLTPEPGLSHRRGVPR